MVGVGMSGGDESNPPSADQLDRRLESLAALRSPVDDRAALVWQLEQASIAKPFADVKDMEIESWLMAWHRGGLQSGGSLAWEPTWLSHLKAGILTASISMHKISVWRHNVPPSCPISPRFQWLHPRCLTQRCPRVAPDRLCRRSRQELRQSLGLGRSLSLGRYGTVRMENVALLPCLETAGRWARTQVSRLTATYQAAGLGDLVSSAPYGEMLELTGEALRQEARQANGNKAILVAHALARLAEESSVVREVTRAMREINAEVDRRLPEFRRLPLASWCALRARTPWS